jgi:diguanylate cyclase (GGDEF)-like protein
MLALNDKVKSKVESSERFPIRFYAIALVLTAVVLVALGWSTYRSFCANQISHEQNFRLQELKGSIIYLDEVLTMSARMTAATGHLLWEERYRRFEPQLDAAIKQAMNLAPYSRDALGKRDPTRIKLVEIEKLALALVRQGRIEEARAILFGREYEEQKQIYNKGLHVFTRAWSVDLLAQELRDAIVYLDEVLTMSARIAAATGDLRWEEHYRSFEPQLDAAIKQAMDLAPYSREAAVQTEAANIKLVEMEDLAFALVRQGRLKEASALLVGKEYETQKQIYSEGMERFTALLKDQARATLSWERAKVILSIVTIIVVFSILLFAWLIVLRTLRKWQAALMEINRDLTQQTSELAKANEELTGEIAERKWAEETLRESERRLQRQSRVLVQLAGRTIIDHDDLKTAIRGITEAAALTLEIERASVWLYNDDRSKIRCIDLYAQSPHRHSEGIELSAVNYPSYFHAMEENRTIAAHDAHADPRTKEFSDSYLSPFGITSMLDAPIRLGGQMVGVVCHEHVGLAREWTLDEQSFAGSIADMVSLAMEHWERSQAEEALRLLVEVTATASESENIQVMTSRCLEKICKLKGWQVGQAWFLNDQEDALVCASQSFYADLGVTEFRKVSLEMQFKKGTGLPGQVWKSGAPVWIVDVTKDKNFPRASFALKVGLKAAFAFPIKIGQKVFAIFEFFSPELRDPDHHFLDAVQKLGSHLGIVLERKRVEEALAEQAIHDALTGLYNRRYFDSRIEEEISRADRNKQVLAILLCDLDHFKAINDTRGHHAGDQVLKAVAKSIQDSTRGIDLVFRWGGDEIVVVLSNATREGALITAERIRSGVRRISERDQLNLDLSIGVSLYPEHGRSVDALIRLADRALYIAKQGGGKVHIGEEEYHLDERSIKVVFQPVVDIRLHQVLGYEALSRDPQGKLSILDLFKRYQAIGQLNELKRICFRSQLKSAQEVGLKRVFINADFELLVQLESVPKPPNMEVILEISEREALHDVENHLMVARKWRRLGYKFAIDDFGAGFISLPFIAQLIPDYIKLDRSTVLLAVSSMKFWRFLKDLLLPLRNYSTEGIIAEGIETEKELQVVKGMGIYLAQGFLLGKPEEIK